MFFGESHEAHETSVEEEKNLEIDDALKVFGANWIFWKEQRFCADKLVFPKKDVVALLPTGFGKSIIYQILPQIHKNRGDDKHVVLAVTPLNASMNEQRRMLRERGIKAAILRERQRRWIWIPQMTISRKGTWISFLAVPRNGWVSTEEWRRELKDGKLGKLVAEIAADEVHVVLEW